MLFRFLGPFPGSLAQSDLEAVVAAGQGEVAGPSGRDSAAPDPVGPALANVLESLGPRRQDRHLHQLHKQSQVSCRRPPVPPRQTWGPGPSCQFLGLFFIANRQMSLVPSILFTMLQEHLLKDSFLLSGVRPDGSRPARPLQPRPSQPRPPEGSGSGLFSAQRLQAWRPKARPQALLGTPAPPHRTCHEAARHAHSSRTSHVALSPAHSYLAGCAHHQPRVPLAVGPLRQQWRPNQPARAFWPQLSPHKFSGLRPAAESVLTATTGGAAPGAERRGQSRRGAPQERPFPGVT